MIVIFTKKNDISSIKVGKYLLGLKHMFIYVDEINDFPKIHLRIDVNDKIDFTIENEKPTFVWFRKNFRLEYMENNKEYIVLSKSEKLFISREWKKIYENVRAFIVLKNIPHLGLSKFMNSTNVNKIEVLFEAMKVGLNIPKTILSNDLSFLKKDDSEFITKPIGEFSRFNSNGGNKGPYTILVPDIKNLNIPLSNIAPSFFQSIIPNYADIRVFYLEGVFFSGVIFKNKTDKDKIDYRMNRIEQNLFWNNFVLPVNIKSKVTLLMNKLKSNFGIIDFVMTPENELFFLEVNVGGQFGDLGYSCNINLELIIANYIKNNRV